MSVGSIHRHQVLLHRLIAFVCDDRFFPHGRAEYKEFAKQWSEQRKDVDHGTGRWWRIRRATLKSIASTLNKKLAHTRKSDATE